MCSEVVANPRPDAFIVDIDGTVATHEQPDGSLLRGHFDYEAAIHDLPQQNVIDLVHALRARGATAIFLTGRPIADGLGKDIAAITRNWLVTYMGQWAGHAPLFMRAAGDWRSDTEIKKEIYESSIKPFWSVRWVLEDRDRVVAMWRSMGITCLQVAKGDF